MSLRHCHSGILNKIEWLLNTVRKPFYLYVQNPRIRNDMIKDLKDVLFYFFVRFVLRTANISFCGLHIGKSVAKLNYSLEKV